MDVDYLITQSRSFIDSLQKLKLFWESNYQWEARKEILCHNWEKYDDKDRLISLSCVWSNVKYMGNRYSAKVMNSLEDLEKGLCLTEKDKCTFENQETTKKRNAELTTIYDTRNLPEKFSKICFVKSSETSNNFAVQESAKVLTKPISNSSMLHSNATKSEKFETSNNFAVQEPTKVLTKPISNSSMLHSNATKSEKFAKNLGCGSSHNLKLSKNVKKLSDEFCQDLTLHSIDSDSTTSLHELTNILMKCSAELKHILYNSSTPGHILISSFTEITDKLSTKLQLLCEMVTNQHLSLYNFWARHCPNNELKNFSWICDVYVDAAFICQEYGKTKTKCKNKAIKRAIHILTGSFYVETALRLISKTKSVQQQVVQDVASTNKCPPLYSVNKAPILSSNQGENTNLLSVKKNNQQKAVAKNKQCTAVQNLNATSFVSSKSQVLPPSKFLARNSSSDIQKLSNRKATSKLRNEKSPIAPSGASSGADYSFVLVCFPDHSSIETLRTSASMSKASLDVKKSAGGNVLSCEIILNSQHIASGSGSSQAIAVENAANDAVEKLKKIYPVLFKTRKLGDLSKAVSLDSKQANEISVSEAIPENNIGNQLLRKMGWSGSGGLGTTKNGISEPIETENCQGPYDRSGLGRKNVEIIPFRLAKKAMNEYVQKGCIDELTFSPDLTKSQRKDIHLLAKRMGLHSQSHGSIDRYLVVHKKMTVQEMAKRLSQTGGELNGYVLASQ